MAAALVLPKKKDITKDEWQKKLDGVNIDRNDLNRLVMNYLVIEGYKEAAQMFEEETGTPCGVDLSSLSDRMEIRNAIQNGNIKDAISKVNDLNPEILENNPKIYFHLHQQHLIELIRKKDIIGALEFAQDELAPRGEEAPEFLEELEKTMSLLAFDPSSSSSSSSSPAQPVHSLLDNGQRQKTASELNAAILQQQQQENDPKLPSILRTLLWSQDHLSEKVNFPIITNLVTAEFNSNNNNNNNNKEEKENKEKDKDNDVPMPDAS